MSTKIAKIPIPRVFSIKRYGGVVMLINQPQNTLHSEIKEPIFDAALATGHIVRYHPAEKKKDLEDRMQEIYIRWVYPAEIAENIQYVVDNAE